jgi:hypothetical protein
MCSLWAKTIHIYNFLNNLRHRQVSYGTHFYSVLRASKAFKAIKRRNRATCQWQSDVQFDSLDMSVTIGCPIRFPNIANSTKPLEEVQLSVSSLFFLSFFVWPVLPSRCRCGVLLLYWSHSDTPHSVGLLWTADQPVAEATTSQNTTMKRTVFKTRSTVPFPTNKMYF